MLVTSWAGLLGPGSKLELALAPVQPDDPARWKPDILSAREKLGWEPEELLENRLARTVAHFQESPVDAA